MASFSVTVAPVTITGSTAARGTETLLAPGGVRLTVNADLSGTDASFSEPLKVSVRVRPSSASTGVGGTSVGGRLALPWMVIRIASSSSFSDQEFVPLFHFDLFRIDQPEMEEASSLLLSVESRATLSPPGVLTTTA